MTLNDLIHPVRRGRHISNVAVVELPDAVWTDTLTADRASRQPVVHHRDDEDQIHTRCGISLAAGLKDGLLSTPTGYACLRVMKWCDKCWPTERHCHCGAPSGEDTTCSLCGSVATDVDKQIERSQT